MFRRKKGKEERTVPAEDAARSEEFRRRGDMLRAAGEYGMAIACYGKAISLDGSNYSGYWGRARCKMDNAALYADDTYRADAERAIDLAPEKERADMRRVLDSFERRRERLGY